MRQRITVLLFSAFALHTSLVVAEESNPSLAYLKGLEDRLNHQTKLGVTKILSGAISDRNRFLDLSYIEPNDTDDKSGWHAKYNLEYVYVADDGFSTDDGLARLNTLEAKLDVAGSYSFGDGINNDDLSSVKASFSYVYGNFGAVPTISREDSETYQNCKAELTTPRQADFSTNQEFLDAAEAYEAASERCKASDGLQALFDSVGHQFGYAYKIGIHAGVEGNQDYSATQKVYGGKAIVSATGWPSLRVELDRVDASSNDERTMLTDEDEYDRVTTELGYQYYITAVKNLPITLSLGYRSFYEIGAPRPIKDAGLDELDHWSVSLRVPARVFDFFQNENNDYSFFVRYTNGQLPFDLESDTAFELGFTSNIALLSNIFQQ